LAFFKAYLTVCHDDRFHPERCIERIENIWGHMGKIFKRILFCILFLSAVEFFACGGGSVSDTKDNTAINITTGGTIIVEPDGPAEILSLSTAILEDGKILTISGKNLGDHPDKPVYYDDFRNANLGDDAEAAGLQKLGSDDRGLPGIVNDMSISGGKSLRMDYSRDQVTGQSLEQLPKVGVVISPSSRKLYVSSWTRFTRYQADSNNKEDPAITMKRVRAGYGSFYSGKPGFYDTEKFPRSYYADGWSDGWIYTVDRACIDSTGQVIRPLGTSPRSTKANGVLHTKEMNTWHRTDYYMDMGDVGVANGEFCQWQDGKENEQADGLLIRHEGFTGGFEWVISDFCGFSEMNIYNKYYLWMDSFYVNTTRARVELGDNKDYDLCTTCFIQPSIAWSKSEISVSLRPGNLNGACYLFIIDEKGEPTEGYPVTVR